MYRKYTLTGTQVINSYNYLISACRSDNQEPALFHQVLMPSELLPVLADSNKIQNYISDSQNQNVVNQNREGFELYFQQNLLQIRIRAGVVLLTELRGMPFQGLLQMLGVLNLDFAIAMRQIVANNQHRQMQCLNNCCRFYAGLWEQSDACIIPFLQQKEKKIHYYDIGYGELFYRGEKEEESRKRESQLFKKGRFKQRVVENKIVNEQQAFKKYVMWLIVLLSSGDVGQLIKDSRNIARNKMDRSSLQERLGKVVNGFEKQIERSLAQLLKRCLLHPEEYNAHIFKMECQLLMERYLRVSDKPVQEREERTKIQNSVEHSDHPSNLKPQKELKTRISKSFVDISKPKSSKLFEQKGRPVRRQSGGRLKYSKSELSLNKSSEHSVGKGGRKLKKATLNMFKGSKLESQVASSSMFSESANLVFHKSKLSGSSSGFSGKSFNFTKMSSAASNWFNSSAMQETDLSGKLRTFKKGNYNNFASAQQSPKNTEKENAISSEVQVSKKNVEEPEEKIGEEELKRFFRMQNRSKAMIARKEGGSFIGKCERQEETNDSRDEKRYFDQQTMTEVAAQIQQKKEQSPQHAYKRSIVNTLSMSYYQEGKSNVQKSQKQVKAIPKVKKDVIVECSPNKVNKQQIQQAAADQVPLVGEAKMIQKRKNQQRNQVFTPKKKTIQKVHDATKLFEQLEEVGQKSKIIEQPKPAKKKVPQTNHDIQASMLTKSSVRNKSIVPKIQKSEAQPKKMEAQLKKMQAQPKTMQAQPKKKEASQAKIISFLPQVQKGFFVKHFQMVLKFCNQHKAIVTSLPNSNNLTFLLNFMYYKTLLESNSSESNSIYKKLTALIQKKQLKFNQKQKQEWSIYRIEVETLWERAKNIRNLELRLTKNLEGFIQGQQTVECLDDLQEFMTLSEQGCDLLEDVMREIYSYLKANKAMLINKGGFETLLCLGYMIAVTQVLCLQRLNYYDCVAKGNFVDVRSSFSFTFKQSEDQYLKKYRAVLSSRQLTYLNSQEQYSSLINWVQQFG